MRTIGLVGPGHIGSQVARLAVKNGYQVVISNSRGPETLATTTSEMVQRHLPTAKVVQGFNHISESWRIQRDTPGSGPRRTAEQLRQDLAAAKRPQK